MKKFVSLATAILCMGILALMVFSLITSYGNGCLFGPVFQDEFDGALLNSAKWSMAYPSGNNGEQQYYAPNVFNIDDGILSIYADQKPAHGYQYSSGIITTQNTFAQKYGYFVIRAKLPRGKGFWPAFWLLPVSRNYPIEIDVFELLGNEPGTIHMANHWQDQNGAHQVTKLAYISDIDFSAGFHTFALEWGPTELKWYIDDILRFQTDQSVPSEHLFLLANLAVGGDWPGHPDETTQFPGVMQIDYIRVYKPGCYLKSILN